MTKAKKILLAIASVIIIGLLIYVGVSAALRVPQEVFHMKDYQYVRPTSDDRLTMYTCWNEGRLGMSEYRLAVICKLTKREWKKVEVPE